MSVRKACSVIRLNRRTYYYKSVRSKDDQLIEVLQQLGERHPGYGFWKMYRVMRRKGYCWNHKKVYRVYKALKMNIRRRTRKRLPKRVRQPLELPLSENQIWSMDFMHDSLWDGRRVRVLNIIDDFNRECLAIEIDTSLSSRRVVNVLDRLVQVKGSPKAIRVDNGPEFLSKRFQLWCQERNVQIKFIQPGRPMQNGYVERFNGSLRKELLDMYVFKSLDQMKTMSSEYMVEYNEERPHDSLNDLTPIEYLNMKNL